MIKTLILLSTVMLMHTHKIGNDIIPDKKTAVAVAEIILSAKYGPLADRWKTYSVKLINDSIWLICSIIYLPIKYYFLNGAICIAVKRIIK